MDLIKKIISEIEDLPELPNVAFKILQKIDDKEINNVELSKYIEISPALSIKILRIINSSYYGLPQKVNSLPQAIGLLGRKTVRNLALTIFILKKIVDKYSKEYIVWENLVYSLITTKFLSKVSKLEDRKEDLIITNILINIPLILISYLDLGSIEIIKNFYTTKKNKKIIDAYLKVLSEKWNIGENLIKIFQDFYLYCIGEKDVGLDIKLLCFANKIANFLALNGEDSEILLKEIANNFPNFSFSENFFLLIQKEANNILEIFEIPGEKDFYKEVFIFFSKANKKISDLLIEKEKLIDEISNVNNLLSTALNNSPLGVIIFENEVASLINVNALEILELDSKNLNFSLDEFIEKYIGKEFLNKNLENVKLKLELKNGHPVDLTYLGYSHLGNIKIVFLKSLKIEKQLKEKYSDLKETYIHILNSAGDGIVITDLKLRILYANTKFLNILKEYYGFTNNVKNKNLLKILKLKEEDILKLRSEFVKLITDNNSELRIEVESKLKKIFELTCTKFIYSGSINGIQFIIRDISEIKTLKEESIKNQVAMELAGTTAHELNQPLTTLTLSLDVLKKKIKDEDLKKYLEKIESSVNKISTIVKKLSKITKYETKTYFGNGKIISLDND